MPELTLHTLEPRIRAVFGALDGLTRPYSGEGEYRCNSPRRPNSNGHSMTVRIDGKGLTYCDHNDAGNGPATGNLLDLESLLGVQVSEPPAPKPKPKPRNLAEYVAEHAGHVIFWQNAGWKDDTYGGKSALSFTTPNGTRYRLFSGESKYISPKGFKQCWYRLSDAIAFAEAAGGPLVLCNGEASVVSAQALGLPATALAGGGEKGTLPPELLSELKASWNGPIVVAMDCDAQGRKAGPALAAFLKNNGFTAHAVNLALFDKGDLADYVKLHQGAAYDRLRALPDIAAPVGRLRFLTSADVDALPDTRPLPGLPLFDETGIALLYGEGGSYKTFVALRWAHDVAKHGPVIYVAAEGVPAIRRRKAALDKLYGKRDGLYFLGDLNLHDAQHSREIEDFGKQKGVKLIVLDTLNRVSLGTKEDTEAYGKLISVIDQLHKALGCLILALHHTPRGGDNPRGGTVLEYATDFGYLQKAGGKLWRGLKAVSVTNVRNRTHELRSAMPYVLVPIDLGDGGDSTLVAMSEDEAEQFTGRKQEALASDEQAILARLRAAGTALPSTDLWRDVQRPNGEAHTISTGPKLLEAMAETGLLAKNPSLKGRPTTYSIGPKAVAQ